MDPSLKKAIEWKSSSRHREFLGDLMKEAAKEREDSEISNGESAIISAIVAVGLTLQVTIIEAAGGTVKEVGDE